MLSTLVSSGAHGRAVQSYGTRRTQGQACGRLRVIRLIKFTKLLEPLWYVGVAFAARGLDPVQHPSPQHRALLRHEHRRLARTRRPLLPRFGPQGDRPTVHM